MILHLGLLFTLEIGVEVTNLSEFNEKSNDESSDWNELEVLMLLVEKSSELKLGKPQLQQYHDIFFKELKLIEFIFKHFLWNQILHWSHATEAWNLVQDFLQIPQGYFIFRQGPGLHSTFPERRSNMFKIEKRSGGWLYSNLCPKILFLDFMEWPQEERILNLDNLETKLELSKSLSQSSVAGMALEAHKNEKNSSTTALLNLRSIPFIPGITIINNITKNK